MHKTKVKMPDTPLLAKDLQVVDVSKQISDDYVSYALHVNRGRALPSVIDGLKPVQRRILYAMHELGLAPGTPFKKCARIEGDVMGKYHPHCLDPDTIVPLMSGKRLSLKQLAESGKDEWVMSWQGGKFVPALARNFAKGQVSQVEYKVWLKSCSSPLVCTGDHEWLANGSWTRTDKLSPGDILQSSVVKLTDADHAERWFATVDRVEAIQLDEPKQYYCCSVPETSCYFIEVDGKLVLTHNSGSYGSIVNLATEHSNRYPLVDGHGNFGSLSDGPAAARYTEARLRQFACTLLLADLDKDWIEFKDNYDASCQEPVYLAPKLPMLLLNSTSGIGVAAACSHVSYNLAEVAKLSKAALQGKLRQPEDGAKYITMPDFAMGGRIVKSDGLHNAIVNGSGSFRVRAKFVTEGNLLIATELPPDVSPEQVLEQTYAMIKAGELTRKVLVDARDESDRSGLRVVWELKDESLLLPMANLLYRRTSCQTTVSVNATAVDFDSSMYSCKGVVQVANDWAKYRLDYEQKKLGVEIEKASARANVLTGLLIALEHIKAVAQALIDGKDLLSLGLGLNSAQIDAIESMPLRSLRAKNRQKLQDELSQVKTLLDKNNELLLDRPKLIASMCKEIDVIAKQLDTGWRSSWYVDEGIDDQPDLLAQVQEQKKLYLLDNRLEGKDHTYYVSSYKVKKLNPIELSADSKLGIAVVMSNAMMYWLPVHKMPVDAKQALPVKDLIKQYTGKPLVPGTYIAWSGIVDLADAKQVSKVRYLIGNSHQKSNCTVKSFTLQPLAGLGPRTKAVWTAMEDCFVIEELPADNCVTVTLTDASQIVLDLSKLELDTITKNGRKVASAKAKAVDLGNVSGKKRGIVKL